VALKVTTNGRSSRQVKHRSAPQFERYIGIDYFGAEVQRQTSKDCGSISPTGPHRPRRSRLPQAFESTGPGEASPNGSSNACPTAHRPSSASTTGSRSRWPISRGTGCATTGQRSSTTSAATGRPATITSTSTLSATVPSVTARPAPGTRDGNGSPRRAPARPSRCFTSMFRVQWPSPRRTADQHDAWVVAEWMRTADANGALASALRPALDVDDRKLAEIEG